MFQVQAKHNFVLASHSEKKELEKKKKEDEIKPGELQPILPHLELCPLVRGSRFQNTIVTVIHQKWKVSVYKGIKRTSWNKEEKLG